MPSDSSTSPDPGGFSALDASRWNALNRGAGPFTDHRFFHALESSDCVGLSSGWHALPGELTSGYAPLWLKNHSHGEFVFDHMWADAAHRGGLNWFPKLVVAVPLTPVTGPRLMADADDDRQDLLRHLEELVRHRQCSSCAINFCDRQDRETLAEQPNWLARHCWQFHWHNRDWNDFDDFLASLKSRPRKNIRRERRLAHANGWRYRWVDGRQINEQELRLIDRCYRTTFMLYGNLPLLNLQFFRQAARSFGSAFLTCIASRNGIDRAAAIFWRDEKRLYGRYWGALEEMRDVHFEACYYQGIEYCIHNRLEAFEPGAQGEHKIRRGFLPTPTYSFHFISHPGLRQAIDRWIASENEALKRYRDELKTLVPYR